MDVVACSACQTLLQSGVEFCPNCGTRNVGLPATRHLIDQAPVGSESGREPSIHHLGGRKRPIDSRGIPEDATGPTAVDPKAPWESGMSPRTIRAAAKGNESAGAVATVVCSIGAVFLVIGVVGLFFSNQFGSAPSAATSLSALHREPQVATGLATAISEDLVAHHQIDASAQSGVARAARDVILTPAFAPSWQTIVRHAYMSGANEVGDGPGAVVIDLTPVVNKLRYANVVPSNTVVRPLMLGPAAEHDPIRGFLSMVSMASLACLLLGVVCIAVAFWRSGSPISTLRTGALAVIVTAVIGFVAVTSVLPSMVSAPHNEGLAPLVTQVVAIVRSQLQLVLGVLAIVGAVVAGLVTLRRRSASRAVSNV